MLRRIKSAVLPFHCCIILSFPSSSSAPSPTVFPILLLLLTQLIECRINLIMGTFVFVWVFFPFTIDLIKIVCVNVAGRHTFNDYMGYTQVTATVVSFATYNYLLEQTCAHTHSRTYTSTRRRMFTHSRTHTHMHAHTHTHTYTHTHAHKCTHIRHIHTRSREHSHI